MVEGGGLPVEREREIYYAIEGVKKLVIVNSQLMIRTILVFCYLLRLFYIVV